jgi:hypothetical protein
MSRPRSDRPPLWAGHPTPPDDPAQALAAAHAFVTRCRAWAVDELARRAENGKPREAWESYLAFTDHTLQELENGTLDHWFRPLERSSADDYGQARTSV